MSAYYCCWLSTESLYWNSADVHFLRRKGSLQLSMHIIKKIHEKGQLCLSDRTYLRITARQSVSGCSARRSRALSSQNVKLEERCTPKKLPKMGCFIHFTAFVDNVVRPSRGWGLRCVHGLSRALICVPSLMCNQQLIHHMKTWLHFSWGFPCCPKKTSALGQYCSVNPRFKVQKYTVT